MSRPGKVKAITEELCGHAFSASAISAINKRLEADVRMLARTHGTDAIDKLVELMRGTVAVTIDGRDIVVPVAPTTQMAAAVTLLDRGYGLVVLSS